MLKVRSKKLDSELICHAFFGKKDGKSLEFYSSLNCSKFVGDCEKSVLKNLDLVRNDLQSSKLITLNQFHTNCCIIVDSQTESCIAADAMVTKASNIAIGVLTADCAPILFVDEENKIIGAAHAGWRGAVSGIIESTIQKMVELGGSPNEIKAAIGPCIAKENYEIDENFKRNFKGNDDYFCVVGSRMCFDLSKYCRDRLIESGLDKSNIDIIGIDSYANSDDYFSYRFAKNYTNGICGRNISAICLR